MDTNKVIERMTVDGRRSEVHTFEQPVDGATHRITEHYEEIVPLEKRKKVTERIVPIIVERVTEQYDGNQVNKVVERVASEGDTLRLTPVPSNAPVTASEVEEIVRKVVGEKPSGSKLFSWFKLPAPSPAPVPVPAPVPTPVVPAAPAVGFNSQVVSYALITFLAVEVGFMIWQLFIR